MKIVCKLIREGGTIVDLGKKAKYHFKPDADGLHVCEVTDKAHAELLLGVDAYYKYGEEPVEEDEPVEESPVALSPADMTNFQLNAWAKERKINPKNKKSITDYVRNKYEIDIEYTSGDSCVSLIREAVTIELEEQAV